MKRHVVFCSRVGDRWSFAVEFEAIGDRPAAWNEWWGSLWLWADGHVVGRPFGIEMVMSGFDPLLESLHYSEQHTSNRTSTFLASLPANQALDLVVWSRYGDGEPPASLDGDTSFLRMHEVLPRGSPLFDRWEAILIAEGLQERFIFRREGGRANEAKWP